MLYISYKVELIPTNQNNWKKIQGLVGWKCKLCYEFSNCPNGQKMSEAQATGNSKTFVWGV